LVLTNSRVFFSFPPLRERVDVLPVVLSGVGGVIGEEVDVARAGCAPAPFGAKAHDDVGLVRSIDPAPPASGIMTLPATVSEERKRRKIKCAQRRGYRKGAAKNSV
jgi:hypothetical protein